MVPSFEVIGKTGSPDIRIIGLGSSAQGSSFLSRMKIWLGGMKID